MATIITKNSSTAGAAPVAGDLVQGELAVNVTSKALYTKNASAAVVKLNTPSIVDNGDATAIIIDSSENVGIGITPSAWGGGISAFQNPGGAFWNYGTGSLNVSGNTYFDGTNYKYKNTGYASQYNQSSGIHSWLTAASGTAGNAISFTQAMTLDSSGNLLVGTTAAISSSKIGVAAGLNTYNMLVLKNTDAQSSGQLFELFLNSSGNTAGSIGHTGTTTVAYTTSSDYRLKENVQPMTGALAAVSQLKPVTYDWIEDKSKGQGFIAHELQAVVPDCVIGEKDAVDADGNPIYQGIDTSFLVATLTAAIQELKATVDAQAARITALEQA